MISLPVPVIVIGEDSDEFWVCVWWCKVVCKAQPKARGLLSP